MVIIRDITQNISGLTCGWDGGESCVGDINCSDLVCSGSVAH